MTEAVALAEAPTIEEALALVVPRLRARKAACQRAYRQRPEVKAHIAAYKKARYQRPDIKAHIAAYQKAYQQRPEASRRRRTRP